MYMWPSTGKRTLMGIRETGETHGYQTGRKRVDKLFERLKWTTERLIKYSERLIKIFERIERPFEMGEVND